MHKNPFQRPGVADEIEVQLRVQEARRAEAARLAKAEAEIGRISTVLRRGLYGLGALAVVVIAATAAYLSGFLSRPANPVGLSTEASTPAAVDSLPGNTRASAPHPLPNPSSAGPALNPAARSYSRPPTAVSTDQLAPESGSASTRDVPTGAPAYFPVAPAPMPSQPVVTIPGVSAAPAPRFSGGYEIKAALLAKFPEFVKWPRVTQPGVRPTLGILGVDPFGTLVESIFGQSQLRRSRRVEDLMGAQMVFISPSESAALPEILATFEGRDALTVGESEGFARRGGMIGFLIVGDKVRFEINAAAARKAGLMIDARLLKLAVRVFETLEVPPAPSAVAPRK
jgi:hypothetical protein